jgi:hypothetical protein
MHMQNKPVGWHVGVWFCLLASGCSDSVASGAPVDACFTGSALKGASYDLSKSRFAFGSTPTPVDAGSLFVGSEDDFDVDGNPVTLPWY